jgi:long-chain acyl-CoA synthetase
VDAFPEFYCLNTTLKVHQRGDLESFQDGDALKRGDPSLRNRGLEEAGESVLLRRWAGVLEGRESLAAVRAASGEILRTFLDVNAEALQLRARFPDWERGAVIAVQLGNHPGWPAALLALIAAEGVVLPVGSHLGTSELERVSEACRVSGVLSHVSGEWVFRSRQCGAVPDWGKRRPVLLKLTSGTTGAPRAIRFREEQILADCDNLCSTMGLNCEDLNFGAIPFSHSYGFSNLITPLVARGIAMVATEDRLPRALLAGLEKTQATVFPGMPVFFEKMAAVQNPPRLPSLRLCISAGAPLLPSVGERFTERFGLKIHTFYGASECGGIAYDRSPEAVYKAGCVGKPVEGVRIEFLEGDCSGRIAVLGAAVGDGYFPEEETLILGGERFVPGDIVERVGEEVRIVGRLSDLINVAGRKVNPAEVEGELLRCAGVTRVVVFGVPSALRGEEPVAGVVLAKGATLEGVRRFCQNELSSWMRPKDVWALDELPLSERGKLNRSQLAERYLSLAASPDAGGAPVR